MGSPLGVGGPIANCTGNGNNCETAGDFGLKFMHAVINDYSAIIGIPFVISSDEQHIAFEIELFAASDSCHAL